MRETEGTVLLIFVDVRGAGAKEKNNKRGFLPLHLACTYKAPVEVVAAVLAAHPDGEAA